MRVAIGKDSKRFISEQAAKTCMIGGVRFEDHRGFDDDRDGDVVFGSICHALTSVGDHELVQEELERLQEREGITDSSVYVEYLTRALGEGTLFTKTDVGSEGSSNRSRSLRGLLIESIAISIEGKEPKVASQILAMRKNIAAASGIDLDRVGISVTTGAGLSDVGCGEGMSATSILLLKEK